ncbi:PEP-CTERM sorting domain-containing protein [Adhaeretor mobilis]|uniref:Ice-binding protein C-terminal domain-containing protein n=1 Tax=Adhaeretor mobilis TaxID=1930276 RepID=A0A517MY03_9BACT|nr:PEP-CTERM sorting domain-containing protein [Adhaeretor mobilis]QDS99746.1 hypothetical protein HG15A2_30760 [Adhaeretor mobilis]
MTLTQLNTTRTSLAKAAARAAFPLSLAMLLALLSTAQEAAAQNAYSVNISSSARYLNALGTPMEAIVKMEESCDNPNNRIQHRNRPSMLVENTGTGGTLTSFTLRIAQDDFVFGTGDNAFDGFNGSAVVSSVFNMPGIEILGASITDVAGQGAEDGVDRLLTVNFSGLAPGESAIFTIDLDTTDANAFQLPDFREVLLGADLGSGTGTPAYTTAAFSSGDPVPELQFAIYDDAIPYAGMNVRPYHAADPVFNVDLNGSAIPEPSSFALLVMGLAGLSRRRRG